MDYFVFVPFEVIAEKELTQQKKKELAKSGRKCMAVVFNCKDRKDFDRKYFGNI